VQGRSERLPDLAAELSPLVPEVMVTYAHAAVQAAKQATPTTLIVMVDIGDPVGAGFVSSLAHPDGNITGLADLAQETVGKQLQLLKTAPAQSSSRSCSTRGTRGRFLRFQAV
jgi:putative ABC transport system substrate-binding protein